MTSPFDTRWTIAAALVAVIGAAVFAVLLITSPWSAGSSEGTATIQGDTDCDQDVDAVDVLFDLKWIAGIEPFGECTEEAGDVDCNGEIESVDGLHILRYLAALDSLVPPGCTPIGGLLEGTATPTSPATATATPTPTAATPTPDDSQTPTATPTPTPTLPPDTVCTGAPSAVQSGSGSSYGLQQIIPGATFERLIDMAVIPATGDREAVIITQRGYLYRVCVDGPGVILPFGDLHSVVNCCGEEGLLSIAFSPDYEEDSYVYLYYTREDSPSTVCDGQDIERCSFIGRFSVTNNTIGAVPDDVILKHDQPAGNHNGGKLLFGPEGYLYLGLGDGGGAFDTYDNGQDKNTILGSVIRIDVSGDGPGYAFPPDNPFVGTDGHDAIWAWGLRNPWRMSFDRDTGDLWLGDVGQDDREEVDLIVKGGNYGWVCYEGDIEENMGADGCPPENPVFPETVYARSSPDCAIVGGHIYRGTALPGLEGQYIFADNCSGRIRAYDPTVGGDPVVIHDSPYFTLSMGELPNGELVLLTAENGIQQLVAE